MMMLLFHKVAEAKAWRNF